MYIHVYISTYIASFAGALKRIYQIDLNSYLTLEETLDLLLMERKLYTYAIALPIATRAARKLIFRTT